MSDAKLLQHPHGLTLREFRDADAPAFRITWRMQ